MLRSNIKRTAIAIRNSARKKDATRTARAKEIVDGNRGDVIIDKAAARFVIEATKKPGVFHVAHINHKGYHGCTCPDASTMGGKKFAYLCKHQRALAAHVIEQAAKERKVAQGYMAWMSKFEDRCYEEQKTMDKR